MKRIALLTLVVLTIGCNVNDLNFDNIQDLTYSPKAAIPLGSASYTLGELIEDLDDQDLILQEGSDMSLQILYQDHSSFEVSTDFVNFGSIANNTTYNLGLPDSPPSPVELAIPFGPITFNFDFPESTGGDLIDSLFYKNGTLIVEISSTFDGTVDYTATMLGTKDIDTNEDLSFSTSVESINRNLKSFDLKNYKTILDNSSGENQFGFELEGVINVPIDARSRSTDELRIDVVFSGIELEQIYGDFGQATVEIQNQVIDFEGFEDFSSTGLVLGSPAIKLDVTNYYGIPILLDVSGMEVTGKENQIVALQGDISDNGIIINAPTVVGESAFTHIEISKDNSNIQDLLSITPQRISIPIEGTTNPNGPPIPGTNNFLIDQSLIEVDATVEVPIEFKMDGFTTDFTLDISDIDVSDAASMSLRIFTTNDLPITGSVTLEILDRFDAVLHTVPTIVLLESPTVGSDGRVVSSQESTAEIGLSQEGIDAFIDGDRIRATINVGSFDADNDTFVKVFSDYKVQFDLSFFGEFSTTLKLN